MSECKRVVRKILNSACKFVHDVDPDVLSFLFQLKQIFKPVAEVYCAGGYPTYLFGYTNTFGDVDFFIAMPESKTRNHSFEHALTAEVPNLAWTNVGTNEYYGQCRRYTCRTTYNQHWNMNIILDYSGKASLEELLDSFDLMICANGFQLNEEENEIVALSLLNTRKWDFPPYMCNLKGERIPRHMNLKLAKRITKYQQRFVCQSLKRMSAAAVGPAWTHS